MQDSTISSDIVRFGAYEADLTAGELRKHGLRIHLQELPFRILTLVLQRPGEVITREELREKLWPADVHVDFEHSLNSAIKKLRTALNDDPERPRFIETIPRRGYRFIGTLEHTVTPSPGPPLGNVRPSRLLLILGSALALSIVSNVVFLASNSRNSDRERPIRRFSLQAEGQVTDAVISPDGRRVAYNTAPSHVLWIQDLEGHQPKQIASPTMGISWSPDGDAIVFRSRDGLTRMQADEGVPVLIGGGGSATLNLSNRWSEKDGNVLAELAPVGPNTLFEISSQGGSPRVLNLPNTILPRFPQYLPDRRGGRQILFQEARNGKQFVVAFDLQSARREVLTEGERPVYSPTGHVLFQRATVLWALPFSLETWKPTGHATVVEKNAVRPSISRDGTLVYIDPGAQQQQLVWRNRLGVEVGLIGEAQEQIMLPVLSPDGKRVLALAGAAGDRNRQDIWLHHGDRRTKTRLTFGNAIYDRPTWHPDGVRFAFSAGAPGKYKLYEQSTVATGEALPITKSPVGDFAFSWSSDGTYLLFDRFQGTGRFSDIWYLRREAGGATEEFPFIRTEFDELSPQFSHDGMYVAYESDRSGRYEVYVTTFPSRDREWQVSTNGGRQPRWRRDGRELFYVEDGAWMVSVPVTPSPVFKAGKPERLFYQENLNARGHRYDVTPDGQRFAVVKTIHNRKAVIRIVQNWVAGLQQSSLLLSRED